MAKDTPLHLPNETKALNNILSEWARQLNVRLREIEVAHNNLQNQLSVVVKKNNLKHR